MPIYGIARVLNAAKVDFTLTDGWRDRVWVRNGRPFDWAEVRAAIVHTTESSASAFQRGEDAPTLGWVTDGQGYHSYSLLIGRSGHVYVISAWPGAQAGYGIWPHDGKRGAVIPQDQGNSHSLGVSMDASVQYPPTPAQLDALARVLHALQDEWEGELAIIGHGEYNGGILRTDPTGVPGGMDAIRDAAKRGTWTKAATITAQGAVLAYTVAPGDTLTAIGRTFGIPAAAIASENRLSDPNAIVVGQVLTIRPAVPVHVVDKGEGLWTIAHRHGLTPERLAALNSLGDYRTATIHPGQTLRLA